MTAVVIPRAAPFNRPLSGAAYDAEILRGYRGVSALSTPEPRWPDRTDLEARAGAVPAFHLDFTKGPGPNQIVDRISGLTGTFTRVSGDKRVWNGAEFVNLPPDTPAFRYNQLTRDWELVLEANTVNSIRNNSMAGASVGAPGTLPTNWLETSLGTLSRQVVGLPVINGVQCIDIRISGTASFTGVLVYGFEPNNQIAATNGTTYSVSAFVAHVAGTLPLTRLILSQRDAAGALLSDLPQTIVPTQTLTRYGFPYTTTEALIAFYAPRLVFSIVSGEGYDFTFRVGWPQAETGPLVTSPVVTSAGAGTRASDSLVFSGIPALTALLQSGDLTVYSEHVATGFNGSNQFIYSIDNSSLAAGSDEIRAFDGTTGNLILTHSSGNVQQTSGAAIGINVAGSVTRLVQAVGLNNSSLASNRASRPADDTVCVVPTGMDRISLGFRSNLSFRHNMGLRQFAIFRGRLSNAQLDALVG